MDGPLGTAAREESMRQFVQRFSLGNLPAQMSTSALSISRKQIAVVTGTTGALGSLVLAKLEASEDVAHVYAFNRRASGESVMSRQERALKTRAVDIRVASSNKVTLLEVDLRKPDFGLSEAIYQEVPLFCFKSSTFADSPSRCTTALRIYIT